MVADQPTARLERLAWPQVDGWGRTKLVVLPVGSVEQHGPHLPLDTDTRMAQSMADALAEARSDVTVAPPIAYGSSGEHAHFAGTLSMGTPVLAAVLTELIRSARSSFAGVVVVSGHGGNAAALARARKVAEYEGDEVCIWSPTMPGTDAHAGRAETSILLAIAPELVRAERAERGSTEPITSIMGQLRSEGVRAVSQNGVLGDPTGATAEEGRRLLAAMVADLCRAVEQWWGPVRRLATR